MLKIKKKFLFYTYNFILIIKKVTIVNIFIYFYSFLKKNYIIIFLIAVLVIDKYLVFLLDLVIYEISVMNCTGDMYFFFKKEYKTEV